MVEWSEPILEPDFNTETTAGMQRFVKNLVESWKALSFTADL
jgi:hypothetical protein